MNFQRIAIIIKPHATSAKALGLKILTWLEAHGCSAIIQEAGAGLSMEQPDCALVLGGDGTLLGVGRHLAGTNIPILGINFGRVGFLCGATTENWQSTLADLLNGKFKTKKCLALNWSVFRNKDLVNKGFAINDVVLSRDTLARLICAGISIDNEQIGVFRGDGLICYTPLGSSGYNLSAGGPLLESSLEAVGLTPVCPFLQGIKPTVFSSQVKLSFKIMQDSAPCFITIDGQEGQAAVIGDEIHVSCFPEAVTFLDKRENFFHRLSKRGLPLENPLLFGSAT